MGVKAFAGKAQMLADGFKKDRLLVVGLQECRSKEGGARQFGDYNGISPDPKSQAAGDVEVWFNTVIPWDQNDFATIMKPRGAQIVATGPKFMIVHLGNAWIDIDIIVAHALLSLETKHQGGAEEVTCAFWEQLQHALTKRARPHALIFFLGDANLELSHS